MVTTRTVDPHTLVLVVVDDDWASAKVLPAAGIADIERHAREVTDGNVGVAFYPIAGLAALPDLLAALHRLLNMTDHPLLNFPAEIREGHRAARRQALAAIAKVEGGAL